MDLVAAFDRASCARVTRLKMGGRDEESSERKEGEDTGEHCKEQRSRGVLKRVDERSRW